MDTLLIIFGLVLATGPILLPVIAYGIYILCGGEREEDNDGQA